MAAFPSSTPNLFCFLQKTKKDFCSSRAADFVLQSPVMILLKINK